MAAINIKGDIIPNDYKKYYDFFEWDGTCPNDVQAVLDAAEQDEPIDVYVNSPGGIVQAGQEIYTALRGNSNVRIHITGEACSAASFIAMAGKSDITPVGLLMVHCAATYADGNHSDMERAADMLKAVDSAIAQAYSEKSGMSLEDAVALMENETWLNAKQCVEYGLIDSITDAAAPAQQVAAAVGGIRLSPDMIERAEREMAKRSALEDARKQLLESLDFYGV